MSSIAISPERISQVESTIQSFLALYEKPFTTLKASDFQGIFHEEIQWFDHAFHICRVGVPAMQGLHQGFTHANQPFHAAVKAIIPTPKGAILEQVWHGRLANSIIRPNGDVAVQATGKDFKCHVCMVMVIDQEGKIRRIDEYYNKKWDDGVLEGGYMVLKTGPQAKI